MLRQWNPKKIDRDKFNKINKKDYQQVQISLQSKYLCNIIMINTLNKCNIIVMIRERGKDKLKQYWGIDTNESHQLYLGTYSRINSIYNYIQNYHMKYKIWKYWHFSMLRTMALAVVVLYEMHLEFKEGELDSGWGDESPSEFWKLRDFLSSKILRYYYLLRNYPGDTHMRQYTQKKLSTQHNRDKKYREAVTRISLDGIQK